MTNESDSLPVHHGKYRFGFAGVLLRMFRDLMLGRRRSALEPPDLSRTGVPGGIRNIRWTRRITHYPLKSFIVIGCILLAACAQKPMVAPSGFGVSSGLGRVGGSVTDANRTNDTAIVHNARAMTNVERIDAKAKVLQKYWK